MTRQPATRRTVAGSASTFTIAVTVALAGTDWAEELVPQVVEASNLHEALSLARDRPLVAWFPAEDDP